MFEVEHKTVSVSEIEVNNIDLFYAFGQKDDKPFNITKFNIDNIEDYALNCVELYSCIKQRYELLKLIKEELRYNDIIKVVYKKRKKQNITKNITVNGINFNFLNSFDFWTKKDDKIFVTRESLRKLDNYIHNDIERDYIYDDVSDILFEEIENLEDKRIDTIVVTKCKEN